MFTHIYHHKKLYFCVVLPLTMVLLLYSVRHLPINGWSVGSRCSDSIPGLYNNTKWEPYSALVNSTLEQYNRFKSVAPDFVFRPGAPKSQYKSNVVDHAQRHPAVQFEVTDCRRHGYVYIDLQEHPYRSHMDAADTVMYQKSKGGSSLFARAETTCSVALCTFVDYFNGVYSVLCPVFAHTVRIKVTVLQTNFQQFTGVMKSTNLVVLDKEFRLSPEEQNDTVALPAPGFEHWTTKWKCRKVVTSELCQNVARMQRLYLIGASHMRYQFHYLLLTCNDSIPDIKQRLYYIDASYGQDVADALKHIASSDAPNDCTTQLKSNLDEKTVAARFKEHIPKNSSLQIFTFRKTFSKMNPELEKGHKVNDSMKMGFCASDPYRQIGILAQTGSWDLSFLGLETSLNEVIPDLDKAFGIISRTFRKMNRIKFLIMGVPAFNPTYYRQGRSNGEIQLYSAAVEDLANKHGLRFFNTFKALYPSFRDSVDSHYLRCDYKKKPICFGQHGMIVFQDVIQTLSDQFELGDEMTVLH